MNRINYDTTAKSFGNLSATCVLIGSTLAFMLPVQSATRDCLYNECSLQDSKYIQNNAGSSYGSHRSPFSGALYSQADDFETFAMEFYETLLSKQQSLGSEIENLIHDNLVNLYEA